MGPSPHRVGDLLGVQLSGAEQAIFAQPGGAANADPAARSARAER